MFKLNAAARIHQVRADRNKLSREVQKVAGEVAKKLIPILGSNVLRDHNVNYQALVWRNGRAYARLGINRRDNQVDFYISDQKSDNFFSVDGDKPRKLLVEIGRMANTNRIKSGASKEYVSWIMGLRKLDKGFTGTPTQPSKGGGRGEGEIDRTRGGGFAR